MRRGKWLFGCVIAGMAGVPLVAGCGDDTVANVPMDSGADQTTDQSSPVDSGVEAAAEAEAAACMTDADLTMLTLPDASLDDAGDTVVSCISCIQGNCSTQVTTCNGDCVCNVAVQKFIQCVASGTGAVACGLALEMQGDMNSTALGNCVAAPLVGGMGPGCLGPCGAGNLLKHDGGGDAATTEGGSDATTEGGGEASTDAPTGG